MIASLLAKASQWLEIVSGGSKQNKAGEYHRIDIASYDRQLENLSWIENATIFTVVRNPFDRLVSGYIDKIGRNSDKGVRNTFCARYGFKFDEDISFREFLEAISSDPFPHELDPHWRPQSINMILPYIVPNFICRLEHLATDFSDFLTEIGRGNLGVPGHLHKRTAGEIERVSRISKFFEDPGIREMARNLYRQDFQNFSYDSDTIEHLSPSFKPALSVHKHPRIGRLSEIVSEKNASSADRLNSELRCVLRDHVFGPKTQAFDKTAAEPDLMENSISEQINALGLTGARPISTQLSSSICLAEAALLSKLCQAYIATLRQSSEEFGKQTISDSKAKRSLISSWIGWIDYQNHKALSKVTIFGKDFQEKFSRAASKRHRKYYGSS